MRRLLSYYHPKLPIFLVYMLQQVEYDPGKFISWFNRLPDLSRVMYRQQLARTTKAQVLIYYSYFLWLWWIVLNILLLPHMLIKSLAYILASPVILIIILYWTVLIAWYVLEKPRHNREIQKAKPAFQHHPGVKIAILGSYGKTTMKELLQAVLAIQKKVAATPGNKNVPISHARWANQLTGDEEVLLIEYGEGAPGDIAQMAELTHPDMAIICGLAPNHLDQYKTLTAVAEDFCSINAFVKNSSVYVNTDSSAVKNYLQKDNVSFGQDGANGWKVSRIKNTIEGVTFTMSKGKHVIKVKSGLLGRHQIGPLALSVVIAHNLGLSDKHIEQAISQTVPYEHRMQPRSLGGGWIIDDTYNGNLEGILAGLELLSELKAKRKIYVTPGLVDQGVETERVHRQIGAAIAKAKPDKVVLMQNSTTKFIEEGLAAGGYAGQLEIRDDPLEFYTNIDHQIAAGDIYLLQNDWTDNYL